MTGLLRVAGLKQTGAMHLSLLLTEVLKSMGASAQPQWLQQKFQEGAAVVLRSVSGGMSLDCLS